MQIENHKGSVCVQRFMICQEGYCSECNIQPNVIKPEQAKRPLPALVFKKEAAKFVGVR